MQEFIRYHRYPVQQIDAMSARSARSYPRHSHDQYGIGVVDEGGHSSWSGRGQVEAYAGTLICCNPGEVTDGRAVGGQPRSWRMLYIEPDLWRSMCVDVQDHGIGEFTFSNPVFQSDETRELFGRAFKQISGSSETMPAETALVRLAACVQSQSTGRARESNASYGCIQKAKERIDSDPSAPLTLSDLADETGLSRYQVIRAFSKELGLTPHAYLMQRRIEVARQLIRTHHTLAEAAVLAGFYDQPHLTRCFTRQFGITPRRYAAAARSR